MQVNPLATTPTTPAPSTPATSGANDTSPAGVETMFMQLLTAQLENQDPLNPVDPSTFTTQLVQFNMLDQLTQINQTLTNTFAPTTAATSAQNAYSSAI